MFTDYYGRRHTHTSHEEEESHIPRISQKNIKDMEVITVTKNSIRNYLTEAELPLPLFDESYYQPRGTHETFR
jgi:hypothetical protein